MNGCVLVTGVKGQLGYDVMKALAERKIPAVGVDIDEMDITDAASVDRVLDGLCGADGDTGSLEPQEKLAAVIHCAAWTAVDAAEDAVEKCRLVNVTGTENIAKACARNGLKMMYISTDYVFDGEGERPWEPDDPVTEPLNAYGKSKYDGEVAVREALDDYFIVRISWVFGKNGKNFIKTMVNLAKTRDQLTVVNDQFGSPTYTADLAELLAEMIQTEEYGIYHATNEGICTWYELAVEAIRDAGLFDQKPELQVSPVTSDAYPAKAKRPHNSRMDKSKLTAHGFDLLPPWQDAVARYVAELMKEMDA